jgi:hypothetical protein
VLFPGGVDGGRFRGYIYERSADGSAADQPCGGTDKSLAGNNIVGSAKTGVGVLL